MLVYNPHELHIVTKEGGTQFGEKGQVPFVYHADTQVVVRAIRHRYALRWEDAAAKIGHHFQ